MLGLIAIVVGFLVAGLLAYAATRPDSFEVKRSRGIQAPAHRLYPLIADFHNWAQWSPFEKLDPAMTKTYSGFESGKGAVYNWSGNNHAGEGRMEIVETDPPMLLRIKLDFLKPFEAHNTAEFTLRSTHEHAAEVTWAMRGKRPYMMKVMSLFVSMDKILGKSFEEGLANLKGIAENAEFSSREHEHAN